MGNPRRWNVNSPSVSQLELSSACVTLRGRRRRDVRTHSSDAGWSCYQGFDWHIYKEREKTLPRPDSARWMKHVAGCVCALLMPCVANLSHRSGLHHPAPMQQLIYWLWHCHMYASESHGKFWRQLWRCRRRTRVTLLLNVSGKWWLRCRNADILCDTAAGIFSRDEKPKHIWIGLICVNKTVFLIYSW